jgi:hypothetical protein
MFLAEKPVVLCEPRALPRLPTAKTGNCNRKLAELARTRQQAVGLARRMFGRTSEAEVNLFEIDNQR